MVGADSCLAALSAYPTEVICSSVQQALAQNTSVFIASLRQLMQLQRALVVTAWSQCCAVDENASVDGEDAKISSKMDLLQSYESANNQIVTALSKMQMAKSRSDFPKIQSLFKLLQDLYTAHQNYLKVSRPLADLSCFRKHNALVSSIRTSHDGAASWAVAPQIGGPLEGDDPNWVTATLFSASDCKLLFDSIWEQNNALNSDLVDLKAVTFTEFFNGLELRSCEQECSIVTFFPDAKFNDIDSVDSVLSYFTNKGASATQLEKLRTFANSTVTSSPAHAAFSFASFDGDLRREDALTMLLKLSEAQHLSAELGVALMSTDKLPTQQWLDKVRALKILVEGIEQMFGTDVDAIFASNTAIGNKDRIVQSINSDLRKWLKPAKVHIRLAGLVVSGFIKAADTLLCGSVDKAKKAVHEGVPEGYGTFCFFAGPMRDQVAMQSLVAEHQGKVSELNKKKAELAAAIKVASELCVTALGIDLSVAFEAGRRSYARANLFISALGFVNLMFIKSTVRLRTFDAAITSVKAPHMWPHDTPQEEATRINSLEGVNEAIPKDFASEVVEFREKLAREENLQSS